MSMMLDCKYVDPLYRSQVGLGALSELTSLEEWALSLNCTEVWRQFCISVVDKMTDIVGYELTEKVTETIIEWTKEDLAMEIAMIINQPDPDQYALQIVDNLARKYYGRLEMVRN